MTLFESLGISILSILYIPVKKLFFSTSYHSFFAFNFVLLKSLVYLLLLAVDGLYLIRYYPVCSFYREIKKSQIF